jgi:hypothetical protein
MKKIAILSILAFGMSSVSCNKCKTCTKSGYDDQMECRGTGPLSNTIWTEELNYWREQGYECD